MDSKRLGVKAMIIAGQQHANEVIDKAAIAPSFVRAQGSRNPNKVKARGRTKGVVRGVHGEVSSELEPINEGKA